MGKPANPNVPYCDTSVKSAISVNGAFFTTDKPPIRYMRDGVTVIVYDADGIIGSADLSNNLVLVNSHAASPNTQYCEGKQKAVLRWNSGSCFTTYPWIKYKVEQVYQSCGTMRVRYGDQFLVSTTPPDATYGTAVMIGGYYDCQRFYNYVYGVLFDTQYQYRTDIPNGCMGGIPDCNLIVNDPGSLEAWSKVNPAIVVVSDSPIPVAVVEFNRGVPVDGWRITVSDIRGEIGVFFSETEPTDFYVDCYDFDEIEISYACDGECPSGTAFQCLCPENNVRMCYGFDSSNPDVFRPLFTTTITA